MDIDKTLDEIKSEPGQYWSVQVPCSGDKTFDAIKMCEKVLATLDRGDKATALELLTLKAQYDDIMAEMKNADVPDGKAHRETINWRTGKAHIDGEA